ncbi:MAG TPA: hypothetical protein VM888_14010 [Chitinophagaceae bacterium]|jgi:hypothetical protein|nr:hypothetical protein [Chitinophagaceae bacterium]
MKKIIFLALAFVATHSSFAQNEKYLKAMEPKVAAIDTTRSVDGLKDLANTFERIADAEKTQWLPYYYAALAHVNSGYTIMQNKDVMAGGLGTTLDPIADKAETLLNKAEALSKDNSEIYVVKKMIASLRMMADPMSRYMTYGPKAAEALETAKKLNPENPRIYYLEGQDKLYTPEQYGGSKTEAKRLLEEAMKKYNAAKLESSIHPQWGRNTTAYFLSQANK